MKQSILLVMIVASLMVVALVSHTLIRHLIQIVPVLLAILLVQRKASFAGPFAAAIGFFWLFIMVLIWLFLLGISNITKGHFTPTEIVMTVVIGIAGVLLLTNSLNRAGKGSAIAGVLGFLTGLGLQVLFMYLSMGDKRF